MSVTDGITSEEIELAVKESPIIRAAVEAERERCANIAENLKVKEPPTIYRDDDIGFNEACDEIAAKIRSGE